MWGLSEAGLILSVYDFIIAKNNERATKRMDFGGG